jgi:NADP-dependent aldehyde dehydrogenase
LVQSLGRFAAAQSAMTMLNQNLREAFCGRIGDFAKVAGVKAVTTGGPTGHAGISAAVFETDADTWKRERTLHEEAFGPGAVVVQCDSLDEAIACIDTLQGSLTGTIHAGSGEANVPKVLRRLEQKVGRVIVNGYPTGVEVCNAIVHGGPYPATTDPASTSVGSAAIRRFVRMTAYQDTPDDLLPPALRNANPLGIERTINGKRTREAI